MRSKRASLAAKRASLAAIPASILILAAGVLPLGGVFAGFGPSCASAEPLRPEEVPPPLAEWVSWALRGREADLCPFFHGQDRTGCAWPGELRLALDDKSGRFEQSWTVQAEGWVPLPGGPERWPQDVRVDGAPAAVIRRGEVPSVRLKPGAHALAGSLRWERVPEQLEVPPETGLVSLNIKDKAVPFPVRDEAGRLWLQSGPKRGASEEAQLDVAVHRRLTDEIPLLLTTRIQLKISGASREASLGPVLPEGFAPMSLTSPLPARLENNGRLLVQARAGTWDLVLTARRDGRGDAIAVPRPQGPWDSDEAWVFQARTDLRLAQLEGAPSIDPQQTELPQEWRAFPAFVVKPGASLRLVESRRGDDPPAPDRLALQRELWLDFDGRGFSARDNVSGTLARSWRLESAADMVLGRVAIDNADQFLTALSSGGPAGVEVRSQAVLAVADSVIKGRRLPASGWRHDFESVAANLRLPPGWRLIHAGGVDEASPTWITSWTLLDFFLVLVAAAAFSRLWSLGWGLAALAGLGLAWHEPGAPRWLWLAVLLLVALDRALAERPKAGRWIGLCRRAAWLILVLVAVPFMVKQARVALYPDLEMPYHQISQQSANAPADYEGANFALSSLAPAAPVPGRVGARRKAKHASRGVAAAKGSANGPVDMLGKAGGSLGGPEPMDAGDVSDDMANQALQAAENAMAQQPVQSAAQRADEGSRESKYRDKAAYRRLFRETAINQLRLDPNARITTGPGLPYWTWKTVRLSWKGPVQRDQRVSLWLVSPAGSLALAVLRVALVCLLVLLLAGWPVGAWLAELRSPEGRARLFKAVLPLVLLLAAAQGARAASAYPPPELLEELRGRLLERPDCRPICAESPRMRLEVSGGWLSLKLEVHASFATAVPVPSGGRDWTPSRAALDGRPAPVRRTEDGGLWVPLPPGRHELVLEGPLPDRDAVQVALPLKPRRVESSVAGWTLHGVRDDGRPEDTLQLTRARGPAAAGGARAQGVFPPFLHVERVIRLGLSWSVETRVARWTPAGVPVAAQIPLLAGESVTSSDLRVVQGKAQVSLAPQSYETGWTSTLKEAPVLQLTAPQMGQWSETWRVEPGPLWHMEAKGLAAAHQAGESGARAMVWRPWANEAVEIVVTRPLAAAGQTLTIDQSLLALEPGLRAATANLTLSLRSSRGGQHALVLPGGSDLLSVSVDGAVLPLRLEGRKLTLPVQPGAHAVAASWREPSGAGLLYRVSPVDLGAGSVNSIVEVSMPARRWTLFCGGRGIGPAVVFWSLLAVFLLVSVGLGKTGLSPLAWWQWFLLSLGLTQISVLAAAVVAGWFLVLGWRGRWTERGPREFKAVQAAIVLLTVVAAFCLFESIRRGLLGLPDMQIEGNGSSSELLRWYSDRSGQTLPRPWVFSVPLWVYRAAMLCWALWLAESMLRWTRWAWEKFTAGGAW